ncbi:amino acid permease [Thelephora ganbajun]|uniref:Amino acid permease n=1 Tax=Thelephora ganbajun TaxID=370292 RepID=A0ACB6ZQV6_THEGA|nr:amino acid permease [Thelephora ganbajun]
MALTRSLFLGVTGKHSRGIFCVIEMIVYRTSTLDVRQMKQRHIVMISIGGIIGTGLFLGTATALRNGGPIGLLLGYTFVGSITYVVMISLGEMVSYLPIAGGHITMAERYVSKGFSFLLGWNYWYNATIALPAELSAAAILVGYWNHAISPAVWITVCLVVVIMINMLGAGAYGEAEFIFASIKVLTIVGLIILGIVLDLGGGPTNDRVGFRYWKKPGPFVQYHDIPGATGRFVGWWSVVSQAAFSFIGTEVVAIAAGEAKNPRRTLPKAIRGVYIRIILFYILGVTLIGLLVPSDSKGLKLTERTAAGSPFVIAIKTAGIKGLPSLINACILTSAWSAASSDLYISSRALYGLAFNGQAPRIFSKTLKNGLPWASVAFCSLFTLIAYMGISSGPGKVFGWFQNMTAIAGLMTWFGICVTYLRFRAGWKAQGLDRNLLPYKSLLQPYAAWYGIVTISLILVLSGFSVFLRGSWDTATFVTNYIPLMSAPILFAVASFVMKSGFVKAEDMDFVTGLDEAIADSYDEPPPKNVLEKIWQWIF